MGNPEELERRTDERVDARLDDQLATIAAQYDEATKRIRRQAFYFVISALVLFGFLAGGGIVYTSTVQQRSDARWCQLLDTLAGIYRQSTNPIAQALYVEVATLRGQFGCHEPVPPAPTLSPAPTSSGCAVGATCPPATPATPSRRGS
jgi:hypothetical protein